MPANDGPISKTGVANETIGGVFFFFFEAEEELSVVQAGCGSDRAQCGNADRGFDSNEDHDDTKRVPFVAANHDRVRRDDPATTVAAEPR